MILVIDTSSGNLTGSEIRELSEKAVIVADGESLSIKKDREGTASIAGGKLIVPLNP